MHWPESEVSTNFCIFASLKICCIFYLVGKGSGYRAFGIFGPFQRLVFWERYLDIELSGFLASPGGCYFAKGSGYTTLGIFGASPWPTTSGLDLKFERPYILETFIY